MNKYREEFQRAKSFIEENECNPNLILPEDTEPRNKFFNISDVQGLMVAFSKQEYQLLKSKLEQAEKEKKELVEFVKNKINGCDELTGMEREKWAFQQVLNQIEL